MDHRCPQLNVAFEAFIYVFFVNVGEESSSMRYGSLFVGSCALNLVSLFTVEVVGWEGKGHEVTTILKFYSFGEKITYN